MTRNSILKTALPLAVMLFAVSTPAQSAPCSQAFYRDILSRITILERNAGACQRATRQHVSIAKMCSICRSTFIGASTLDAKLRRNKSCLAGVISKRKWAELDASRAAVNFVRRGCGY